MQQMAGMKKPSWRDAPEWAISLNQSEAGEWFWSSLIDVSFYIESRPGLPTSC